MKILLVVSPNFSMKILQEEVLGIKKGGSDFTRSVDFGISGPMGILYIAGGLRRAGHDVRIYDLHREFNLCRQSGYFKKKGLTDFFEEHFERMLKNDRCDILGISGLFNVSSDTVEMMGISCKAVSPDTVVVMGGHYPTNMYRELLRKGCCDYVILGEAEEEFVWLSDNIRDPLLKQKVSDNSHIADAECLDKHDKIPAIIDDLDSLAMPAWDLLPHAADYIENSMHSERVGSSFGEKVIKAAPIFTTRGCPMRCTFCAASGVHGRQVRAHSIDFVMRHIDWLVENYGINHLLIEDDMFNFSPKRTAEFCNAIYDKYKERFSVEFPNGLAIWNLNDDVVKNLKKIGLNNATIAVESGNQYVQKNILKKNLNLNMVKEKIDLLKEYDIGVRAFFIIGLVGETLEMMRDTVRFALDLNINWSEIKVFTPLVGSEMYDIASKNDYLVGDKSEHVYGRCCVKTPDFTPEEVENIRYDANIRVNFLNNRFLKEKRFIEAESVFQGVLGKFPGHVFAQWGLWQALQGQGKTGEAESARERLNKMIAESENVDLLAKKYKIMDLCPS